MVKKAWVLVVRLSLEMKSHPDLPQGMCPGLASRGAGAAVDQVLPGEGAAQGPF